jgi:hypothetical protein
MKTKLIFILLACFSCYSSFGVVRAKCLVKYIMHYDTNTIHTDTIEVDFFSGAEMNTTLSKFNDYVVEPLKNVFGVVWLDHIAGRCATAVIEDVEMKDDDSHINTEFIKAHTVTYGYDKEMNEYNITVLSILQDNTK